MTFRAGTFGFDISTYQDAATTPQVVDFRQMRAYGASFVIIRVGQANYIDQDFRVNYLNSKGHLPRAAYWFYDPRYDPLLQADLLLYAIGTDKPEGRIWLDLEFTWVGEYTEPFHWKTWLERVRNGGFRIGIYSNFSWWEANAVNQGADLGYFGAQAGWVAQYNDILNLIPRGWPEPYLWQQGTPAIGRATGVESEEIDFNFWNENKNFETEWGPPLPPIGELSMARFEAQSNSGSSRALRPDHNTMNSPFEYVGAGKKMHGEELWTASQELRNSAGETIQRVGDTWLRVLDVDGNTTRTGWVAIIHMGQTLCTLVEINPPDPDPQPEPDPDYIVAHWVASGRTRKYIPE